MLTSIYVSAIVLAFSAARVAGHAAINPALGVTGTAVRNDVQRPKAGKECGNIAVAGAIDSSTPVVADASGAFTVDVTDFNAGKDGSRSVTMQVDAAGTGTNFVAGKVTTNGNANPTSTGTDQVSASLPAGTTCTGGASGDLCLVSFTTTAGFGNCVVVQQGGAAGGAAAGGAAGAAAGGAAAGNAKGGKSNAAAGANGSAKANNNAKAGNAGAAKASAQKSNRLARRAHAFKA